MLLVLVVVLVGLAAWILMPMRCGHVHQSVQRMIWLSLGNVSKKDAINPAGQVHCFLLLWPSQASVRVCVCVF